MNNNYSFFNYYKIVLFKNKKIKKIDFNLFINYHTQTKMYIAGNGDVYDDEEIMNSYSKINEECDEDEEEYNYFEVDKIISLWETNLKVEF